MKWIRLKHITDLILNVLAVVLPMIVLQFFLLPKLAISVGTNRYGFIISAVSIVNISAGTLGTTINNSRLIHDKKLRSQDNHGDYNRLLIYSVVINTIFITSVMLLSSKSITLIDLSLILLFSILYLVGSYLYVDFRINLNYKNILTHSLFLIIGNIIGYLIFSDTQIWQMIYLFGYLFALLFDVMRTNLLREGIKKSILYKFFRKEFFFLLISALLISTGSYLDKIIIYPILGATMVAHYYIASLLGKTFSSIIGPISSLILSYVSGMERFSKKTFNLMLILSTIFSLVSIIFIIIISEIALSYLYPNEYIEAMKYVIPSTIATMIFIIGSLLNTILIKFNSAKNQIVINGIYTFMYLFLGIPVIILFGLNGFIYTLILTNLIRLIIIYLVFVSKIKKEGVKKDED